MTLPRLTRISLRFVFVKRVMLEKVLATEQAQNAAGQTGKSSLMVRTAARLREEGVAVIILDLTAIGQNLSADQWYDGLLRLLGQQLNLEEKLDDFWLTHSPLAPLQRWMAAPSTTYDSSELNDLRSDCSAALSRPPAIKTIIVTAN